MFSESVEPLSKHCDPNMTQNAHVYAICCRPEVAGDVISGENVQTVDCYVVLTLLTSEILKNHFVTAMQTAAANIDYSIKRKSIRVSL